MRPYKFEQEIVLGIGMAQVLSKALGVLEARLLASGSAPGLLHLYVFIDPVLPQQPISLARVAGEHAFLEIEGGTCVDEEMGFDGLVVAVDSPERIDEIQMGDRKQGGRWIPLAGDVVRR